MSDTNEALFQNTDLSSSQKQTKKKKCDFSHLEPKLKLTDIALSVLKKRYLLKDQNGEIIETPFKMFHRIAHHIAQAEKNYGATPAQISKIEERFLETLIDLDFVPNSPTFTGAGTRLGQLSACFVLPVEDSIEGIFQSIKDAALIHQSGGGTGFSFSRLRPRGSRVRSTTGVASGPVPFMRSFDAAAETVKQGATRRGANMGILRVDHADIYEFITSKADGQSLTNFNISVAATDAFMKAVEKGTDYDLFDPQTQQPCGKKNAREVFQKIIENAWLIGDPGMIFIDRINQQNPLRHTETIEATNPCGEQPLPPYGTCDLGHLNLSNFVLEPDLDWNRLKKTIRLAVRFLDNVLDISKFPLEQVHATAQNTRRIGLGVMGFADTLIKLKIAYNSDEGIALGEKIMRFVHTEATKASEELAKERGNFPEYPGSIYEQNGQKYMRNGTITTVAPTGTTSIFAGVSSGIEPLYAISFVRNQAGLTMIDVNPFFEKIAKEREFYSEALMKKIAEEGSVAHLNEVPEDIKKIYVTAHDISPTWHVKMQAAFQKYVDSSISKTINFPNSATVEDVRTAYIEAYKTGCKGITIYRDGSRTGQVLSTGKTNAVSTELNKEPVHLYVANGNKEPDSKELQTSIETAQEEFRIKPRPRPPVVSGTTEEIKTGMGSLFVTINEDQYGPFEVFATVGKSGSETLSMTEAVGRLISVTLRSGIEIHTIISHLKGIRGSAPVWHNGELILSIPDAIGKALERFIERKNQLNLPIDHSAPKLDISIPPNTANENETEALFHQTSIINAIADNDLCPECGSILNHGSGCLSCPNCAFSKC